jgi:hypothetical protein
VRVSAATRTFSRDHGKARATAGPGWLSIW